MSCPLCFFVMVHLICFTAATESEHVSVDDKLLQGGSSSGRRTGRLYCRVGIGFHLQIHPDGRVNGSHVPDQLSVLELFAISQGVVGIRGIFSKRFLAMNKKGRLHATVEFTDNCKFRERFQENGYNTYASATHRNWRTGREWFVALNKRGKAKMGSNVRVKSQHVSTHFLPRFDLHEKAEQGFTITDGSKEKVVSKPQAPQALAPPPAVKPNAAQNPKRSGTVKYWPKFRFG